MVLTPFCVFVNHRLQFPYISTGSNSKMIHLTMHQDPLTTQSEEYFYSISLGIFETDQIYYLLCYKWHV